MRTQTEDATDRVGNIQMRIRVSGPDTESVQRWERRDEVLATWLTEQWQREQRRRLAERN